jgi:UDP-N-acetylmuramoyl-tripeptide--D-alanyl-D-alanine ligase
VVGDGAIGIADGAASAGLDPARIVRVPDAESALDVVTNRLRDGDVVLLKASRGIGLDRVVDGLRHGYGIGAFGSGPAGSGAGGAAR